MFLCGVCSSDLSYSLLLFGVLLLVGVHAVVAEVSVGICKPWALISEAKSVGASVMTGGFIEVTGLRCWGYRVKGCTGCVVCTVTVSCLPVVMVSNGGLLSFRVKLNLLRESV